MIALVLAPVLVAGAADTVQLLEGSDGTVRARMVPTGGPSTEFTFARLIYAERRSHVCC